MEPRFRGQRTRRVAFLAGRTECTTGRKPPMAPSRIVPLISDTESKPTAAMRKAIARAEVGDEQRGEDPTVNTLQQRDAELLGKEAALWFPGGTMCNFVAIKVHTKPGDAIVADGMAHIIRAESAGVAVSSGVVIESIATDRGVFSAAQLREAVARLRTAPRHTATGAPRMRRTDAQLRRGRCVVRGRTPCGGRCVRRFGHRSPHGRRSPAQRVRSNWCHRQCFRGDGRFGMIDFKGARRADRSRAGRDGAVHR